MSKIYTLSDENEWKKLEEKNNYSIHSKGEVKNYI